MSSKQIHDRKLCRKYCKGENRAHTGLGLAGKPVSKQEEEKSKEGEWWVKSRGREGRKETGVRRNQRVVPNCIPT